MNRVLLAPATAGATTAEFTVKHRGMVVSLSLAATGSVSEADAATLVRKEADNVYVDVVGLDGAVVTLGSTTGTVKEVTTPGVYAMVKGATTQAVGVNLSVGMATAGY